MNYSPALPYLWGDFIHSVCRGEKEGARCGYLRGGRIEAGRVWWLLVCEISHGWLLSRNKFQHRRGGIVHHTWAPISLSVRCPPDGAADVQTWLFIMRWHPLWSSILFGRALRINLGDGGKKKLVFLELPIQKSFPGESFSISGAEHQELWFVYSPGFYSLD